MKKYIILGLAFSSILASCKKEGCTDTAATNYNDRAEKDDNSCTYASGEPIPSYTIPTTYSFVNSSNQNTVDYPGQLDRLEQIRQIISKMDQATSSVINAQDLKDMFSNVNGNGNGNFSFASTRQLKDKCFSLDQSLIESWMDSLAENSTHFSQSASNGQAGTLMVEGSLHLFSSKGVEYAEKIEKALMGAVQMYQALNVYFGSSKMDVDNSSAVDPANGLYYTIMEHSWDEAFGYFGVQSNFPQVVPQDLWGEYCNNQNSWGSNAAIMNNFLKGRAAISNKVLADRDGAIVEIRNAWEKISAYQAMDYLNEAIVNIGNTGLFFHALTEANGFVTNLKYAPEETRNVTQSELSAILNKFGTNYWNLTLANLQAIKADLDAKY